MPCMHARTYERRQRYWREAIFLSYLNIKLLKLLLPPGYARSSYARTYIGTTNIPSYVRVRTCDKQERQQPKLQTTRMKNVNTQKRRFLPSLLIAFVPLRTYTMSTAHMTEVAAAAAAAAAATLFWVFIIVNNTANRFVVLGTRKEWMNFFVILHHATMKGFVGVECFVGQRS